MNQINLTMEIGSSFDLSVAVGKPSPQLPSTDTAAPIAAAALTARTLTGTVVNAEYQEVSE